MKFQKSLRFCSWNIEGLSTKLYDEDFLSIINSFDCISLVENWLSDPSVVNLPGFYSSKLREKSKRANRNSGGITVLIKSELRKGVRFLQKQSSEEFIWWKLEKN